MNFYIESVTFTAYQPAFYHFRTSRDQPIGRDLYRRGLLLRRLARTRVPRDSGALARSLYVDYRIVGSNPLVEVGSHLNYALYVHEGSRPHVIRSKRGRTMRFMYNGKVVYAGMVHHPGNRPTRYLTRDLRQVVR